MRLLKDCCPFIRWILEMGHCPQHFFLLSTRKFLCPQRGTLDAHDTFQLFSISNSDLKGFISCMHFMEDNRLICHTRYNVSFRYDTSNILSYKAPPLCNHGFHNPVPLSIFVLTFRHPFKGKNFPMYSPACITISD